MNSSAGLPVSDLVWGRVGRGRIWRESGRQLGPTPTLLLSSKPSPTRSAMGGGGIKPAAGAQAPPSVFKEGEVAQTPLLPASTFVLSHSHSFPLEKSHTLEIHPLLSAKGWRTRTGEGGWQRRGKGLCLRSVVGGHALVLAS